METLIIEHRNQYYSRSRAHGPSRGFKDINCRAFQSGVGILPTPLKGSTTTVTKRSPKTPSPSVKSSSIPIPANIKSDLNKEGFFNDELRYSELWAGPAYSNSPPPSSLPIPKFSLCSKRTVLLDLPERSASDIDFHPIAKSAPASPTGDRGNYLTRDWFHRDDSAATKTLRRILNLDTADE